MRGLVRWIDGTLRRRQGVFEFCQHPLCLFRGRVAPAVRDLVLPQTTVKAGEPVLELHFWNEQIPQLPLDGPDMRWGVKGQRMLSWTCGDIARRLGHDPRLDGVRAVGGSTILFFPGDASGGERVFRRLGFTTFPPRNRLGRFGEFWENLHAWLVMWTFNRATVRVHRLLRLRRTEFWTSTEAFVARHAHRHRPPASSTRSGIARG